jgi:hypothetical protein
MQNQTRVMLGRFEKSFNRGVLEIYNDGFIIYNKQAQLGYSWNQLVAYTHSVERIRYSINFIPVYAATHYKLRLNLNDGREIVLTKAYQDVARLAELLPETTFPYLMNLALDHLQTHGSLQFGSYAITPTHVSFGRKSLPWSQIGGANFSQGYVVLSSFKPNGKLKKVAQPRVKQVPNAFVFVQLANKLALQHRQPRIA